MHEHLSVDMVFNMLCSFYIQRMILNGHQMSSSLSEKLKKDHKVLPPGLTPNIYRYF